MNSNYYNHRTLAKEVVDLVDSYFIAYSQINKNGTFKGFPRKAKKSMARELLEIILKL